MSKPVNITLYRLKEGRCEHRVVECVGLKEEIVDRIKNIINSQGISVFSNRTLTFIEIRYKNEITYRERYKPGDHFIRIAFKGLSPTKTRDLLSKHL